FYYIRFHSQPSRHHRHIYSFPTRRSSDLVIRFETARAVPGGRVGVDADEDRAALRVGDRDSLRQRDECVVATREHGAQAVRLQRSEEHTSELQSPDHLVCRLLLEKKK